MRAWKTVLWIVLGAVLAVVVSAYLIAFPLNKLLVDLWWFQELGYGGYFWARRLYPSTVLLASVVVFFLVFFANFWIGTKYLDASRPLEAERSDRFGRPGIRVYERFRQRSLKFYVPVSLALALLVSMPLFFYWEETLLFLFAPRPGMPDPIFGNDIGFYLFSLPIYLLVFWETAVALLVVLAVLTLLYRRERRTLGPHAGQLPLGARIHLGVLVGALFAMGAWYVFAGGYRLLYARAHMPLFYGPGFTEINVTLPLIWVSALLLLLTGALAVYFLVSGKGAKWAGAAAVVFLLALGLRVTPFLEAAVQRLVVEPNAMTRQTPYIAKNIASTLAAYGLTDVETRVYPVRENGWGPITPEVEASLDDIPLWDEDALIEVYRELQQLRPYYRFEHVDVGRYVFDDDYRQVFLSPRQIDLRAFPDYQQTWVNRWLRYTHGYGLVMTPAAQDAGEPMPWLVRGIPPESVPGLSIEEPAIYFGDGPYHPAIAPNEGQEVDYAAQDEVFRNDYRGSGGVPVSSLFRKLTFSLYFGDWNILLTDQTGDDSRLLFRRNIEERIRALTPFLMLAPDHYAAVANGRIYWIQNAFTYSSRFPYARPYAGPTVDFPERFNYIRPAVAIVVDAYDGSVDYYITDPEDPIVAGYARIFPGLFKRLDDMPGALRAHIRYPRSLFDAQMDIYARYHQTDPDTYYNQEDLWELARVEWRDDLWTITSAYLTLNLIDPERFSYTLFVPMTPVGRHNMRVLAAAGNEGRDYGRIVIYSFPKGSLVYGPAQVEAFVRQDPRIAKALTLWQQEGVNADLGRMVVVPVDNGVAYIQGLFLQATAESRIPQLARVIVSDGRSVVMASSVEEGFRRLNRELGSVPEDGAPGDDPPPPVARPPLPRPRAAPRRADAGRPRRPAPPFRHRTVI